MSRKRESHHNGIGWVLLAAGLAGAALGYRDRLVFAVGIGILVGVIIGFAAGSKMKNQTVHYYDSPEPQPARSTRSQPARAEVGTPSRRELARAQRNGWAPPQSKNRMILLSPECLSRDDCLACHDNGCQCPCNHDPATIVAWNAAHYDAEHEQEPADVLADPGIEEIPF